MRPDIVDMFSQKGIYSAIDCPGPGGRKDSRRQTAQRPETDLAVCGKLCWYARTLKVRTASAT